MHNEDLQIATEHRFTKKAIHGYILEDLRETPEIVTKIDNAVALVLAWMMEPALYESKQARKNHLMTLDIHRVVESIICETIQCLTPVQLTVISGKLAPTLKFDDLVNGLKTIGELLTIVSGADLYDLLPPKVVDSGTWCVRSRYALDEKVLLYIANTMYLPPMICKPAKLKKNTDSAYLICERDSVILKSHNHHDGEVCLEHLNRFNKVELSLCQRMLDTLAETVPEKITDSKARSQFTSMIEKSYEVYDYLLTSGNRFRLTHKYCKRGRTYAQGYHVSTQGNPYKKSIVELYNKELIEWTD